MRDVHMAIAKYEYDKIVGRITFDPNGFAHYPYGTDPWLESWIRAHLPIDAI